MRTLGRNIYDVLMTLDKKGRNRLFYPCYPRDEGSSYLAGAYKAVSS